MREVSKLAILRKRGRPRVRRVRAGEKLVERKGAELKCMTGLSGAGG